MLGPQIFYNYYTLDSWFRFYVRDFISTKVDSNALISVSAVKCGCYTRAWFSTMGFGGEKKVSRIFSFTVGGGEKIRSHGVVKIWASGVWI